jgi:hypothetical protein
VTAYTPGSQEKDLGKFALSLQQLAAGRSNATGNGNAHNQRCHDDGNGQELRGIGPHSSADDCSRATEFGAGTWYFGTVANGSFVITHVNSATASRTFLYALHG